MLWNRLTGFGFFDEVADPNESFGEGLEVPEASTLAEKMAAEVESPAEEVPAEPVAEDDEDVETVSYKDFLKENGLDYEGDDPFELAQKVAADAKRAKDLESQLLQLRQAQQHQPQPQQQYQAPVQQPAQPQIPQHVLDFANRQAELRRTSELFTRKPKTLDFSDRIKYDDDGNMQPVNPADYTAVREAHEAAQWLRDYNAQVATNLPEFIAYQVADNPTIGYMIQQAVQQAVGHGVQQHVGPMQQAQRAEQLWLNYADKVYGQDDKPTPYGQVFLNTVQTLRAQGMEDPEKAFTIADSIAKSTAPMATPPAEVKVARKQMEVLKKHSQKTPSAGGSLPKSEQQAPGANRKMTLEERMKMAAGL